MFGTTRFLIKFAATVALVTTVANQADASNGAFMKTAGQTSIPIGHYQFCKTNPEECRTKTRGDVRVKLNEQNWNALLKVNYDANLQIAPITDAELYGTEEFWTYSDTAGDCEDYVLVKRRALMAMGWPPAALLITVVRQRNGEGHAVLTVRTDRGDLVLDNLETEVMLWNQTDYTYLKRQSKNHTGKWETITDGRVTSVGAVSTN